MAIFLKLPEPEKNYIYDLSGNQINPDNFPFSIWARLMRETISRDKDALMTKSFCAGIKPIREAIAAHLYSFRGMAVDPSQILIGAGTEYLYGILLLLLGKDKLYCVENPGYKKIYQIYEKNGARCTYADMDEAGITVDSLKKSGLYEKCSVLENNSGLHFILQFNTKKKDEELKQLFEKKSIHMQPISDYYYKRTDTQHRFILNYSNVDKEMLDKTFNIIKKLL